MSVYVMVVARNVRHGSYELLNRTPSMVQPQVSLGPGRRGEVWKSGEEAWKFIA